MKKHITHKAGDRVIAKITSYAPFGAFADLEDGGTGLIRTSEIADGIIGDISALLPLGCFREALVIDLGERPDSYNLSLKRLTKRDRQKNIIIKKPLSRREYNKQQLEHYPFAPLGKKLDYMIDDEYRRFSGGDTMVKVEKYGGFLKELSYEEISRRNAEICSLISRRDGLGHEFLGWLDYASSLPEGEIARIEACGKRLRKDYEVLVICGIGGSYLGARAAIDAIKGLYSRDSFKIIFFGNTLSSTYASQILSYLKDKRYAVNVISKSGTTTETSIAFRLLKEDLETRFGHAYLKDAVVATTDKARGALHQEAVREGYETFVIPDDIGGRYSVITPVGLVPIAAAGIDVRSFVAGVRDGEKDYSADDFRKNPAYAYGASRYLLHKAGYPVEMFVTYEPQFGMIAEWLKQLFAESEGKDGKGLLPDSVTFTTDLHSVGQFIQQGSKILFETIVKTDEPIEDLTVKPDKENLDELNYLSGRKLSYINDKAFEGTLDAHVKVGNVPAQVIRILRMDAYHLGNLFYFFMRACAYSAYLLGINPFNQPGVEIYKKNMFVLLGKPGIK